MDPYELLGVSRDATPQEIRKAFRRIARECHPDVTRDDPSLTERFKRAREAYEILMDPARAVAYERARSEREVKRAAATEAFYRHTGRPKPEDTASRSAPPSGKRRAPGAPRGVPPVIPREGTPIRTQVVIDAAVAAQGGKVALTYPRLERVVDWQPGQRGASTTRVRNAVEVAIAPGTEQGAVVTLPGMGNAGQNGGPYGDLIVTVRIASRRTPAGDRAPR